MKELVLVAAFLSAFAGGIMLALGAWPRLGRARDLNPVPLTVAVGLVAACFMSIAVAGAQSLKLRSESHQWARQPAWAFSQDVAAGAPFQPSMVMQVAVPQWQKDELIANVTSLEGRSALTSIPRGTLLTDSLFATRSPELCDWLRAPRVPQPDDDVPDGGTR